MSHTSNPPLAHVLRTVFLDRDGVINEKMPEGEYVTSQDQFHLLPGAADVIALLKQAGLRVIVVSNQRGIALGRYSRDDVYRIHSALQTELAVRNVQIDGFYFCPHDKNQCHCRKPLPGLFEQAKADFHDIETNTSLMVGDSLSDIQFGKKLGMRTAFIEGNPQRSKPGAEQARRFADFVSASLSDAVQVILALPQTANQPIQGLERRTPT